LQVHPWQEQVDVEALHQLPQQAGDDSGWQDGERGDFAVGQDPIDQEEAGDAEQRGGRNHDPVDAGHDG